MYSFYALTPDAKYWYASFLRVSYLLDHIEGRTEEHGDRGVLALTGVNSDLISDPEGPPDATGVMLVI